VQTIAPGARLIQVDAGPPARIEKEEMIPLTETFAAGVEAFRAREGVAYDLIHSHYWLSVEAGDRLAAAWDVPHLGDVPHAGRREVARASVRAEPAERLEAERRLVHRSIASSPPRSTSVSCCARCTACRRHRVCVVARSAWTSTSFQPAADRSHAARLDARRASRPDERVVLASAASSR
jgi:hypothetical protein